MTVFVSMANPSRNVPGVALGSVCIRVHGELFWYQGLLVTAGVFIRVDGCAQEVMVVRKVFRVRFRARSNERGGVKKGFRSG